MKRQRRTRKVKRFRNQRGGSDSLKTWIQSVKSKKTDTDLQATPTIDSLDTGESLDPSTNPLVSDLMNDCFAIAFKLFLMSTTVTDDNPVEFIQHLKPTTFYELVKKNDELLPTVLQIENNLRKYANESPITSLDSSSSLYILFVLAMLTLSMKPYPVLAQSGNANPVVGEF